MYFVMCIADGGEPGDLIEVGNNGQKAKEALAAIARANYVEEERIQECILDSDVKDAGLHYVDPDEADEEGMDVPGLWLVKSKPFNPKKYK